MSNFITADLVPGASCGAPSYGRLYRGYVTSTQIKTYSRTVSVVIVKNNAFIETRILTIPANTNKSGNQIVFQM